MSSYVKVVAQEDSLPLPPPEGYALKTGYEPDRFQKFAIAAIEKGENVLVTAKTGSGKTFVGEYQIAKSLARGGRIFYTTPIKSLSNQKFHDLKVLFPNASVGIMTGDIKYRPDAQIIVMTTEILRNLLFKRGSATEKVGLTSLVSLENLDSVIMDECHYINDKDRGHVWEETLILLDPKVKLILLSATLSSPYGFAKWLGELKKVRIWLISTLWRAVPLEHYVITEDVSKSLLMYDSREVFHMDNYRRFLADKKSLELSKEKFKEKVKDARTGGQEGAIQGKVRIKSFEQKMNELLEMLHHQGNLPGIFFVFSRKGCENLARRVTGTFLDTSDSAAVANIWDFHLARYKTTLEQSPQFHALKELVKRGIAFHHSGILPFLKEMLEILFTKGYIKVLFATETFAVGINMPTKTVVFTALEKFTDGQNRLLQSSEYIQMAGRAGRRGKDDRGLVYYLPQRDPIEAYGAQQMLTGKSSTFGSRMNFHYDFVLKTLNGKGINSSSLIEGSYWKVLEDEEARQEEEYLVSLRQKAEVISSNLTEEQKAACHQKSEIENRISQSQNSKKKIAKRDLDSWCDDHKESVWNPIVARWTSLQQVESEIYSHRTSPSSQKPEGNEEPSVVHKRKQVLEEFGYAKKDDLSGLPCLTQKGILASEVNEGHPFLMTEFFLRIPSNKNYTQYDILVILSIFLGEGSNKKDENKPSNKLNVSDTIREEIQNIEKDSVKGIAIEKEFGVLDASNFWEVSTEWVEPIALWLEDETLTLSMVANKFGLFEGNFLKALMKLDGLLEECISIATLSSQIDILTKLEGAKQLILRDVILAESLYLRI